MSPRQQPRCFLTVVSRQPRAGAAGSVAPPGAEAHAGVGALAMRPDCEPQQIARDGRSAQREEALPPPYSARRRVVAAVATARKS